MTTERAVALALATPAAPLPVLRPAGDIFNDPATFEHSQRVAKVFASSRLVPEHMRGNVADCLIAIQIARRLNEEPLTVMQNIYMVAGRPGWYSAYMIARAKRSGVFKGGIRWKSAGEKEALSVTAFADLAETGDRVEVTTDMRMAKAEGWTKNAKYTSMPEHMLRWRSAAMLIRLYAPEVMLGLPVVEELETMPTPAEMRDVTPSRSIGAALDAFAAEPARTTGDFNEDITDPATGEIITKEIGDPPSDAPTNAAPDTGTPSPVDGAAGRPADPLDWSLEDCEMHGREGRAAGVTRKAVVPPALRVPQFAEMVAAVLAGWDGATAETEAA